MLARICDAMRVLALSGQIGPETMSTLQHRMMSVEAEDNGGSDQAVVIFHLERLISRLRDELGASY